MTMTTWGPSFKGTGSPPEGYVQGTPVRLLSKTGMGWTSANPLMWFEDYEYRLPADHPFYNTAFWGPEFAGNHHRPKHVTLDDRVQFRRANDSTWSEAPAGTIGWLTFYSYRLRADHPYYRSQDAADSTPKTTPEEAAVKLLTELGYTGITPPDPFQKDRDFVADMWGNAYGEGNASQIAFRKGSLDSQVRAFMTFIRENKERI